ncbi:RNAse R [Granulicella pectinivorans]|uniref:Ribonuclease R n=1 Tax=Granulicella pectinivorans TaxID=474950 RepID=A0A1I6L016_9BACT|nr:VacB/RNase II family 3'-5' exoribonuclease [Granulicella pectinivorans]SFR96826.1 RNAse R [Granulicella pectinivorans]
MGNTPYPQTDRDLIRRIERSPNHRAGYKQLVRELGLGGGRERRLLLEQLGRITLRGDLVKIDAEMWSLPAAAPEKTARPSRAVEPKLPEEHRATRDRLLTGRLDLHRDGFGFVRPEGMANRDEDLFIPPHEINGAMQGDLVLVDEAPRGRDGRRSGRIARVLTRRNPTVVGIFHYARTRRRSTWENAPMINGNYVTPLDERMGQPILIPDGLELPATQTTEVAHRVLGEEALAAAFDWKDPELREPLEGLAVDVEITDFPLPGRPAKGRVIEVLGRPDDFGVDVEIVIRKHHIPHVFPANVLAEATASAEQTVDTLAEEDLKWREDFRHLSIVTIDGETARDFDDAVHVTPHPDGTWELQVHIADVSHYVRPGTDLDLEARLRGTSVYFPDRAVPMLPPQLSSGMCSLRPDEDRLVLSCIMQVDARGEISSYRVAEGIIRSARRMTYTQVQAILDHETVEDKTIRDQFLDLGDTFEKMYALALLLNAKRKRRGSIDFDLPEPVIRFDPQGNMESIVRSERGWSHRLIEEFMLSANECVAHWLEAQAPSIYRIHEMPDPKRIVEFEETAGTFGYSLGIATLPVKKVQMKSDRRDARGSGKQARTHEVTTDEIPVTPQMYQRLTAKIAGTAEERILAFLMLRSLKQARYSEQNVGHFALASPSYTHFTSPIRRYPDLIVHRLLRALLQGGAEAEGGAIRSDDPQPWAAKAAAAAGGKRKFVARPQYDAEPIPVEELAAIAGESSQSERRADDAERELMEWKKMRFMQDRVGEDFSAIILSCTKYGFFVELDELFIEGLVPIASLGALDGARGRRTEEDRYVFRDTDRQIVGTRSGRVFKMGQRVRVLLDRIDQQQRRLQFALIGVDGQQPAAESKPSPNRSGKPRKSKTKERTKDRKNKGKRKKK